VGAHGAQLIDPLLLQLSELLVTLSVALDSVLQLLMEPGNVGLRLVVRESQLFELALAGLMLVEQALEILGQVLIELQDLGI
jgi:hypothetical protein